MSLLTGKDLRLGKIEGKKRQMWQKMRWLDSITDSMDMSLSKLRAIVKDRGAWCTVVNGIAKSLTWQRMDESKHAPPHEQIPEVSTKGNTEKRKKWGVCWNLDNQ